MMRTDKNNTPLVDEHLMSFDGISEAETKPFFYSRLRNRMDQKRRAEPASGIMHPVYVICTLFFFLLVNFYMIINQKDYREQNQPQQQVSSLSGFASAYNLTVSSY